MPRTTENLEKSILSSKDLPQYLHEHEAVFNDGLSLVSYVDGFLAQRKMSRYRMFRRADIPTSFGYEMLNGSRQPNRNTLLRIAFFLGMGIEQTQKMLNLAESNLLYPRRLRDSVILFSLREKHSIVQVNAALEEHGLETI